MIEEPQLVGHIRRAVANHTTEADAGDHAENATDTTDGDPAAGEAPPPASSVVPGIEPLPAAGVGLEGPGAHAAARGALIAALSAGQPTDPDAHTEVVTPPTP